MSGADQPGKDRRAGDRRARERRDETAVESPGRDLVPVGPVTEGTPSLGTGPASAFAAQMLGQPGQKRGLKGGPPVLGAARGAYLETNYSGAAERRPTPGKDTDTDI